MTDEVFIVALLKSPAQVLVQSGNKSQAIQAPAGISAHSVPMGVGQQKFVIARDGQTVMSGTSLKDIVSTCICGIYNFNAYVGTLPAPSTIDRLQPAGLAMLSHGLKVPCPTNILGGSTVSTGAALTATAT
jgi:Glycosyl hydrolase family 71.